MTSILVTSVTLLSLLMNVLYGKRAMNKTLATIGIVGILGLGAILLPENDGLPIIENEKVDISKTEVIEKTKPVIDTKIDDEIAKEQEKELKDFGKYKGKEKEVGTDGIERQVIPYISPDGRQGYTIVYEKTEILTDKNGSTTEKVHRQQIDYGHEGRTELW